MNDLYRRLSILGLRELLLQKMVGVMRAMERIVSVLWIIETSHNSYMRISKRIYIELCTLNFFVVVHISNYSRFP